jgi:hypothetical protein
MRWVASGDPEAAHAAEKASCNARRAARSIGAARRSIEAGLFRLPTRPGLRTDAPLNVISEPLQEFFGGERLKFIQRRDVQAGSDRLNDVVR